MNTRRLLQRETEESQQRIAEKLRACAGFLFLRVAHKPKTKGEGASVSMLEIPDE